MTLNLTNYIFWNKTIKIKSSLAGLLTVATLLFTTLADAGPDIETNANGVTLAGHDFVSYFTDNAAVAGKSDITAVHNGAIYYFSSEKNRDLFNGNADKYAPQYGGFCAYGAALGKKFDIDGNAFEVVDGKLCVNKNLDVYETWVEDKAENIVTADSKWNSIKNVPAAEL